MLKKTIYLTFVCQTWILGQRGVGADSWGPRGTMTEASWFGGLELARGSICMECAFHSILVEIRRGLVAVGSVA
jgi:hypothetical protein